jgi:hypothetical protein
MDLLLSQNDTSAGGWMTLVLPLGTLLVILVWGWTMRRRIP